MVEMEFKYKTPYKINFIYIQPTKTKWKPGINLIRGEFDKVKNREYYQQEFMKWMAFKYKEEIIKVIDRQRYDYKWEPLTIPYYKWKRKNSLSLKIWEATGFLKNHIVVKGKIDHVEVGFRFWDTYPNSRVHPVLVSRCLEFGVPSEKKKYRIPPRPLWRPLYRYMRKHVRDFWEKFLTERNISVLEGEIDE